jgi:hypothetical protein
MRGVGERLVGVDDLRRRGGGQGEELVDGPASGQVVVDSLGLGLVDLGRGDHVADAGSSAGEEGPESDMAARTLDFVQASAS